MTETLTIKQHAELVDRMADTLGLDLEEKVLEGLLDPMGLSDAVLRCTGCSDKEGCNLWLDAHHETGASTAPVMCRNGDIFELLKQGKRA